MAITKLDFEKKVKVRKFIRDKRNNLYLIILPSGKKSYHNRQEKSYIRIGNFPKISLNEARDYAMKFANGVIKLKVDEDSFVNIATEWLKGYQKTVSSKTYRENLSRLKRHVYPYIGDLNIRDIKSEILFEVLQKLQEKDLTTTAQRILNVLDKIYRFAVLKGKIEINLCYNFKGVIQKKAVNHAAFLKTNSEIGELVRKLKEVKSYQDNYLNGSFNGTWANMLLIGLHTAVRTHNLRKAKWEHFDLNEKTWNIPSDEMKMKKNLIVPLSRQVIEYLLSIKKVSKYVFPSNINSHHKNDYVNKKLRELGYSNKQLTWHGVRSMFSTKMNDNLTGVGNFNSDWIEKQLGHSKVDVRATYNRDYDYKYLKERSVMMQKWSDFLDKCETGGTILNFAKKTG